MLVWINHGKVYTQIFFGGLPLLGNLLKFGQTCLSVANGFPYCRLGMLY